MEVVDLVIPGAQGDIIRFTVATEIVDEDREAEVHELAHHGKALSAIFVQPVRPHHRRDGVRRWQPPAPQGDRIVAAWAELDILKFHAQVGGVVFERGVGALERLINDIPRQADVDDGNREEGCSCNGQAFSGEVLLHGRVARRILAARYRLPPVVTRVASDGMTHCAVSSDRESQPPCASLPF